MTKPESTTTLPGRRSLKSAANDQAITQRVVRPVRVAYEKSFRLRFGLVLELLERGFSLRSACARADLPRTTLYERSLRDDEINWQLMRATERRLAKLEEVALEAATRDWRPAFRLLQSRDPGSWSARAQIEIANTCPTEGWPPTEPSPVEIRQLFDSPETAQRFRERIDEALSKAVPASPSEAPDPRAEPKDPELETQ
jgi:hypothetical protein